MVLSRGRKRRDGLSRRWRNGGDSKVFDLGLSERSVTYRGVDKKLLVAGRIWQGKCHDRFYGLCSNAYKKDIEDLIGLMYQPLNTNGQPGMAPNQGQPGMNMQQPVYVRGADMSRYAPMALVFSILGFIFTLFIVIMGILFGTMGIVYGKKAMTSQKKGMATAAFVIGIIDVVIAVVVWILNIMLLTM